MITYIVYFALEGATLPANRINVVVTSESVSKVFEAILMYTREYEKKNHRKIFLLSMQRLFTKEFC